MDFKEFGVSVLEYFIANIPTVLIMIPMILSNLKNIKKEVNNFDKIVFETEKKIVSHVENKIKGVVNVLEQNLNKTIDKVDLTLDKIGGTVDNFKEKIYSLENQVEHLFKTNKTAFDLISILVSKDEKLIESGVSSLIVNKLNLTKDELEKYPKLIETNKNYFYNAMKEQYILLGKENFEKMLLGITKEVEDYAKK